MCVPYYYLGVFMKSMVAVFFFSMVAMFGRADAQLDVKIGGGALLDPTRAGGHLSIEVPIGDLYPTYLAPFVEYYRGTTTLSSVNITLETDVSEIPAGVSLIYKAPLSDRYGTVFFGVGGGVLHARGFPVFIPVVIVLDDGTPINVIDPETGEVIMEPLIDPATGELATGTSTEALIAVAGGMRFDVAEGIGAFVQGRWFRAFASGSTNNFGFHAGLMFSLGER